MKIAIGADHAGFLLKEYVREKLIRDGHQVADYGTNSKDSIDYPDYAAPVAHDVSSGKADRGILVCYTGIGMAIAANKVRGVRAAPCTLVEQVQLTRAHNNANILALGAKLTTPAEADALVDSFLATPFEGGRHERRVAKITRIEEESAGKDA